MSDKLCYPFSTETCDRPACKCRETKAADAARLAREHEQADEPLYIEGLSEHIGDLVEAIKPFAEIVTGSSGRIPTERLSAADWHRLVKAYNYAKSCGVVFKQAKRDADTVDPETGMSPRQAAKQICHDDWVDRCLTDAYYAGSAAGQNYMTTPDQTQFGLIDQTLRRWHSREHEQDDCSEIAQKMAHWLWLLSQPSEPCLPESTKRDIAGLVARWDAYLSTHRQHSQPLTVDRLAKALQACHMLEYDLNNRRWDTAAKSIISRLAEQSAAEPTPPAVSRTYGELPDSVAAWFVSHEWDNMTPSEQRDALIERLAFAREQPAAEQEPRDRLEKAKAAFKRIMEVSGTSCLHHHIARDALAEFESASPTIDSTNTGRED